MEPVRPLELAEGTPSQRQMSVSIDASGFRFSRQSRLRQRGGARLRFPRFLQSIMGFSEGERGVDWDLLIFEGGDDAG